MTEAPDGSRYYLVNLAYLSVYSLSEDAFVRYATDMANGKNPNPADYGKKINGEEQKRRARAGSDPNVKNITDDGYQPEDAMQDLYEYYLDRKDLKSAIMWREKYQALGYNFPKYLIERYEAPLRETTPDAALFRTDTDMPIHLDMMKNPEYFAREKGVAWKIIHMRPEDYMEATMVGFGDESWGVNAWALAEASQISQMADKMKKGTKFDMPSLRYYVYKDRPLFGQEGRHRALAARESGASSIPVFVEYPSYRTEFDIAISKMSPAVQTALEGVELRETVADALPPDAVPCEYDAGKHGILRGHHWPMGKVLYHRTHIRHLDAILRDGIKPSTSGVSLSVSDVQTFGGSVRLLIDPSRVEGLKPMCYVNKDQRPAHGAFLGEEYEAAVEAGVQLGPNAQSAKHGIQDIMFEDEAEWYTMEAVGPDAIVAVEYWISWDADDSNVSCKTKDPHYIVATMWYGRNLEMYQQAIKQVRDMAEGAGKPFSVQSYFTEMVIKSGWSDKYPEDWNIIELNDANLGRLARGEEPEVVHKVPEEKCREGEPPDGVGACATCFYSTPCAMGFICGHDKVKDYAIEDRTMPLESRGCSTWKPKEEPDASGHLWDLHDKAKQAMADGDWDEADRVVREAIGEIRAKDSAKADSIEAELQPSGTLTRSLSIDSAVQSLHTYIYEKDGMDMSRFKEDSREHDQCPLCGDTFPPKEFVVWRIPEELENELPAGDIEEDDAGKYMWVCPECAADPYQAIDPYHHLDVKGHYPPTPDGALKPIPEGAVFDESQLHAGMRVELEHTDDPEMALTIAKHHLLEDANYYRWLVPMEKLSSQGVDVSSWFASPKAIDDQAARMADELRLYQAGKLAPRKTGPAPTKEAQAIAELVKL